MLNEIYRGEEGTELTEAQLAEIEAARVQAE